MIVPVIVIPYQGNLLFGSSLYEGAHTDKHDNRLLHCVPYFLRNLAARITFFRCLSSCPTRKLSQIIICWQVQRFLFIFLKIISGKQKFLKFFCIPPTLISSPEFCCHMIIHDSCLTKFFAPPLSPLLYFFGVYDGGTVCVAVPWPPESGTVASYRYRERDNIITRQAQRSPTRKQIVLLSGRRVGTISGD